MGMQEWVECDILSPSHPQAYNDGGDIIVVRCDQHIVTRLIIGDLLLLAAYLWGLYVFRVGAPEHLAALMETVN